MPYSYNTSSVILGTLIVFFCNYIVVNLFLYLFFKLSKLKNNLKGAEVLIQPIAISFVAAILLFSSLIFFAKWDYFYFVAINLFLSSLIYGFVAHKIYRLKSKEKYIFTIILSILLNPVWLLILGVMK